MQNNKNSGLSYKVVGKVGEIVYARCFEHSKDIWRSPVSTDPISTDSINPESVPPLQAPLASRGCSGAHKVHAQLCTTAADSAWTKSLKKMLLPVSKRD